VLRAAFAPSRLAHLVDVSVALELVELFRGMLSFDEGQGPQLSAAKTLHLVLAAARILQVCHGGWHMRLHTQTHPHALWLAV